MSDFGLLATGMLLAGKTSNLTSSTPIPTPAADSSQLKLTEAQPIENISSLEVATPEFSPHPELSPLESMPVSAVVESTATPEFSGRRQYFSDKADLTPVREQGMELESPLLVGEGLGERLTEESSVSNSGLVTATPETTEWRLYAQAQLDNIPAPQDACRDCAGRTEPENREESDFILLSSPIESCSSAISHSSECDSTSADSMSQVTSVSQLSDVRPTDWAYEALRNLVERYGVITGYPDGTFRGSRALTRYEFAAALNAALEKVTQLQVEGIPKEDLLTLERLQQEFVTELAQMRGRVDGLEARTADLERQQFSDTTRLFGQAIFGLQGSNEVDADLFPRDGETERSGEAQLNFAGNVQLSLATSFNGRDLLLTGLQAGNLVSSAPLVFTNMGRLSTELDTGNDLLLSDLSYRFPLSPNFGIIVGPAGVNPVNTFRGINPLESAGDGAISLFGQRNPILSIGNGTGGIGFDWQMTRRFSLQAVYSAENPSFTSDSGLGGLFDGRNSAGVQLTIAPTNTVDIGLHYLYSHSPDGFLGSGVGDNQLISPLAPIISPSTSLAFNTHAVGATLAWRVNPRWTLGGWGGLTFSDPVELSGSVETTNWMVFSAFPDLFGNGNLGGVLFGQPPKITSSSLPDGFNLPNFLRDLSGTPGGREDTAYHLELFYRARLSDRISLTPGVLVIFNPDHNAASDTLVVGTLRATFQF